MSLAVVQLEFLSRSFWWAAVVAVTGIALLVYAILLRREIHKNAAATGTSLATVSLLAAIASLILTVPVGLLNSVAGQWLAMLWTMLVLLVAVYLFYRRVYRLLPRLRMATLFSLRALGLITLTFLL